MRRRRRLMMSAHIMRGLVAVRRRSPQLQGLRCCASVATVAAFVMCAGGNATANVLLEARVQIAMRNPHTCDVTASIALELDRAGDIEQRVQRLDGSRVELLGITGAVQATPSRSVGATEAFVLRFPAAGSARYEVRYRATQPEAWAYRCPVWLPAVAADGRSRNVEIEVTLPPAAEPGGGSFPAFQWHGGIGRATLGHLPAFVRLPYAARGEPRAPMRDVGQMMELAAIAMLVTGMALWVVRRRR
jgi:hypothetical protein